MCSPVLFRNNSHPARLVLGRAVCSMFVSLDLLRVMIRVCRTGAQAEDVPSSAMK